MCWYCYWGLPEPVAKIYDKFKDQCDLHWGRGHVVWEDSNLDSETIQWCIEQPYKGDDDQQERDCDELIKESLLELLAVPESIRCPIPGGDEVDPHNEPEKFPPPDGMVMLKR